MKIAIITSRLGGGGAERAAAEVSRYLNQHHEVVMIIMHDEVKYPYGGKLVNLGYEHRPQEGNFNKIIRLVQRPLKIKKVLQQEQPDIILSYVDNLSIFSLITKVLGQKGKFVTSTQNPPSWVFKGMQRKAYDFLISKLFPKADTVIALSKGIQEELHREFGIPRELLTVIYNPIHFQTIKEKVQEPVDDPFFDSEEPILINVGRLEEQKNQVMLLKAFKKVVDQMPARLAILGVGPLEQQLLSLQKELGLESSVKFVGWQDNPFKFMKASDLFVLSSDFEGFGNVIVEAMACDCPVVSTDCDFGPGEILMEEAYGGLVPVNDPDAMAEKIVALLSDSEKMDHYRTVGKKRALDFEIDVIGAQYEEVFQSIYSK